MKNVELPKFDKLILFRKLTLFVVFMMTFIVKSTKMGHLLKLKSKLKINKYQSECDFPMDKLVTSKK